MDNVEVTNHTFKYWFMTLEDIAWKLNFYGFLIFTLPQLSKSTKHEEGKNLKALYTLKNLKKCSLYSINIYEYLITNINIISLLPTILVLIFHLRNHLRNYLSNQNLKYSPTSGNISVTFYSIGIRNATSLT